MRSGDGFVSAGRMAWHVEELYVTPNRHCLHVDQQLIYCRGGHCAQAGKVESDSTVIRKDRPYEVGSNGIN